jgi:hypothetical protein
MTPADGSKHRGGNMLRLSNTGCIACEVDSRTLVQTTQSVSVVEVDQVGHALPQIRGQG